MTNGACTPLQSLMKVAVLPPHEYILYIGIAGYNSQRSLRERYKDYLNAKKVIKRAKIARMIGTWHEVLRFFFAPVETAMFQTMTSRRLNNN